MYPPVQLAPSLLDASNCGSLGLNQHIICWRGRCRPAACVQGEPSSPLVRLLVVPCAKAGACIKLSPWNTSSSVMTAPPAAAEHLRRLSIPNAAATSGSPDSSAESTPRHASSCTACSAGDAPSSNCVLEFNRQASGSKSAKRRAAEALLASRWGPLIQAANHHTRTQTVRVACPLCRGTPRLPSPPTKHLERQHLPRRLRAGTRPSSLA